MRKQVCFFFTAFLFSVSIFAQNRSDLLIYPEDLRLSYEAGAKFSNAVGFHLYIRKKPGLGSVMLVETTKDPDGEVENFAFRTREYNEINGDEIRYLDGKKLDSPSARYSLIDSTVEPDEQFGEAFHLYIPSEIEFGYPWTRNGVIKIDRGTFINIRAFQKPYGDYSGDFADNPYMFDLAPRPNEPETPPPAVAKAPATPPAPPAEDVVPTEETPEAASTPVLTDDYNPTAVQSFDDIAAFSGGQMVRSNLNTLVDDIMASLARINPKERVDVVFAVDTTGSMKDDVQTLRKFWLPRLEAALKDYGDLRVGLLLYRDYTDNYKYMNLPVKFYNFTTDLNQFSRHLNSFIINGKEGGDIPEAVYEALWGSLTFYKWRKDAQRKIILIGDAQPHPTPRGNGKYTKELIATTTKEKGVVIDTIIVPDDKKRRGR